MSIAVRRWILGDFLALFFFDLVLKCLEVKVLSSRRTPLVVVSIMAGIELCYSLVFIKSKLYRYIFESLPSSSLSLAPRLLINGD